LFLSMNWKTFSILSLDGHFSFAMCDNYLTKDLN